MGFAGFTFVVRVRPLVVLKQECPYVYVWNVNGRKLRLGRHCDEGEEAAQANE
jgi:hypothetical protein